MLKRLIGFSIENAGLVILLAVCVLAAGVYRVVRMPVDVFPELNAPTVVLLSEAPGYAADEVEQYVTFPIEAAVNGLTGVRRVRSGSALGLSLIYVEFEWGADLYRARQIVSEGLATVLPQLPEDVHTEMAPITGITGEIMLLALRAESDAVPPQALRAFAEFELRQALLSVPGVAQVVAIGGELPEYQINVRQDRLRLYGMSLDEVTEAAREAHTTASAGYLANVQGEELPLRQTGRVRSVADIRETVVRYIDGAPVTLGDVADIELGAAPPRGSASANGRDAVVVTVKKAPGTNTLAVTQAIDELLDGMETAIPAGMTLDRNVMRQSDFIGMSLNNLLHVLRDAAFFVSIVLILFLLNVRTTFITLTAIPLSVAIALVFLDLLGLSINVMTLGGLAIAIGELVDDAIIDVENVYRRLRENALLPASEQRPIPYVVYEGSNEIRSSVVFATIIIVAVFVPLLFLEGIEGRFFQPMGTAYIVSILASLLVALTVVPALCRYLLPGPVRSHEERDSFLLRGLKRLYRPTLEWALRLRYGVISIAFVLAAGCLWLGSTFGSDFLPAFNEGMFTVFVDAPPGISLEESDRMVQGLDKRLSEIEGVRSVVRRTGRAERDEHAHGVNRSEIQVTIEPGYDKREMQRKIDGVLEELPGLLTEVGSPINHQLSHVLSGTQAAIAINVYGDDLGTLQEIARRIELALGDVPGARDVLANRGVDVISLPVRYRHEDLSRWGMTPADAARQVSTAFNGLTVAAVNDGIRRYLMVVRLHPEERGDAEDVRSFLLTTPQGAQVELQEVADVAPDFMPLGIQRENGRRKAVVSLNVAEGHNIGHVVEAVREVVDPIVAEYGYSTSYGGQFEAQQSASRALYLMGAFVGLIVLLLLRSAFGSGRAAVLVMVNLPLALIGGILAIFVTEGGGFWRNVLGIAGIVEYSAPVVSIASLVGFVTLFGIAVRNGILLVNHYAHLMEQEGKSFEEAVRLGSEERLAPILMTALTAVLGLLPLAMAYGEPGSELLAPLAIVVLGGLISATALNLIVVPAGYYALFKNRPIVRQESLSLRATEAEAKGSYRSPDNGP